MSAKLIIDLKKCEECKKCDSAVECSYKHHPDNQGIDALLEKIRFALICRKCEVAPCIKACPREALEKVPIEGSSETLLERANMLCTGCGMCATACPFGTIYTDLIPFATSVCDVCRGRLKDGEKPLCVKTCPMGALDYSEISSDKNQIEVFKDVVVKVPGGATWQPFLRQNEKVNK